MSRRLTIRSSIALAVCVGISAGQVEAARPLPEAAVDFSQSIARGGGQRFSIAPSATEGMLTTGERVPELFAGEFADTGPQFLLVPTRPRHTWFEAGADVQYYYTSNVFLTEKGNVDTGVLLSTLLAGLTPPPIALGAGELALSTGYRHQRYNYGLDSTANQLNNFDFDVGTVYLKGQYTLGQDWNFWVALEYNRYLSAENDWTEFYTEWAPQWGVQRLFRLEEKQLISVGYYGAHHFTYADPAPETNVNDRLDSSLSVAFRQEFGRGFFVEPFYRFQHSYFTENTNRYDIYHTAGASLVWVPNDWLSVRAFGSFEVRDSTDPTVQDYHKWDTGGGLSVAFRF